MYVNSHLKKGARPIPLEDFVLFRTAWDPKPQAAQAEKAASQSITSVFAAFGKVNRKR